MNHSAADMQAEDDGARLPGSASRRARKTGMVSIQKLNVDVVLIEVLVLAVSMVCIMTYNWIFKAAIPPALGVVVGGINGTLVAWCIAGTRQDVG